jgi:hypothetical protein
MSYQLTKDEGFKVIACIEVAYGEGLASDDDLKLASRILRFFDPNAERQYWEG